MNKQTQLGMIFGIVAFMLLMVWFFTGSSESSDEKLDSRVPFVSDNWMPRYQLDDKNPLGLYLFTTLTKAHLDTNRNINVVENWSDLDSITGADDHPKTYMFIGNVFQLQNEEIDSILSDVNEGSQLFLSFEDLTENLYSRIFRSFEFRLDYAEEVNVFVDNKKYNMINIFQNDTVARDWWAFGDVSFEEDYVSLSSFMEMPNFLRVNHGKGFIYLHSTPNMYYNYQLKRASGYRYAAYTLDNFPTDNDVYLLELGRRSENYGDYNLNDDGEGDKDDDSYLQLIFRSPALLAALMLSILGLILFVIFRSKRRRPIVPFIPKKKDMTLAFAETITSIYFSKRNPYGLLQVQRKNFYDTVHRYFFVDLKNREGDRELQILAEKSDTPLGEIKKLMAAFETKDAAAVSEQFIAELAKKKYQFYRRVGIISDQFNERVQAMEMVFKRSMLLPIIFVLSGISLVIVGLYLLVIGIGVGIVMWPVGMILIILGILRLSKPYLVINQDQITYYSPLGVKREVLRSDLTNTDIRETGVILTFRNNNKLIINYWDLSSFDRKQFERFVSKLHTLEL
jgi:hypothetical protein